MSTFIFRTTLAALLVLPLAFTTGCKKKAADGNALFPSDSDLTTNLDAAAASAEDADRLAANADGSSVPDADGGIGSTTRSTLRDGETGGWAEPLGKAIGELGTAVPELGTVFFQLDKSDLDVTATTVIDRNASYLTANPTLLVILRGHCDDSGTDEYNIALGSQRAQAVRDALIGKGIPAARIETISFGESIPAVEGEDEASRSQNRRVEFFVYTIEK